MKKRKLHLNWKGYYSYTSTNVNSYVSKKAGVYKLLDKLKSGKLWPFYVGQALDLNDRLNNHLRDSEKNDCIKDKVKEYECYFKFALLPSGDDRDGAERALYIHYESECNDPDAIPSGPDIEVNYD